MADLTPLPVEISLSGSTHQLAYPMRAVILYQRETMRIEQSRPHPPTSDPKCICGEKRSAHHGADLYRTSEDGKHLHCPGFRPEDPLVGDSLFIPTSWKKIDLAADPERWLACLWCGLHREQEDKTWKAPYTLEELAMLLNFSNAGEISRKMVEALTRFMPQAEKPSSPKDQAPAAAAPEERAMNVPTIPPSSNSGPTLVGASDSLAKSS